MIVFNEQHLRRILSKYASYYNEVRPTLRLERTRRARARSSGSETLSRSLSLAVCTIDTPGFSFRKRQGLIPPSPSPPEHTAKFFIII
jgi:hypothetical protein